MPSMIRTGRKSMFWCEDIFIARNHQSNFVCFLFITGSAMLVRRKQWPTRERGLCRPRLGPVFGSGLEIHSMNPEPQLAGLVDYVRKFSWERPNARLRSSKSHAGPCQYGRIKSISPSVSSSAKPMKLVRVRQCWINNGRWQIQQSLFCHRAAVLLFALLSTGHVDGARTSEATDLRGRRRRPICADVGGDRFARTSEATSSVHCYLFYLQSSSVCNEIVKWLWRRWQHDGSPCSLAAHAGWQPMQAGRPCRQTLSEQTETRTIRSITLWTHSTVIVQTRATFDVMSGILRSHQCCGQRVLIWIHSTYLP